jgi:hypothetical protein
LAYKYYKGRGYKEVLHRLQERRKMLHTIKRRKDNCIGDVLRRNCLLNHVIKGNTEWEMEGLEDEEEEVSSYWS